MDRAYGAADNAGVKSTSIPPIPAKLLTIKGETMNDTSRIERCVVLLLLSLPGLAGCERSRSPAQMPQTQLMSALDIVEWDLSDYVGHGIRIEGVGVANGKCEIKAVEAGMHLATQISPLDRGIHVYVIDDAGTSSTKIDVDPAATAVERSRQAGVLYEESGAPVVILTRIGP